MAPNTGKDDSYVFSPVSQPHEALSDFIWSNEDHFHYTRRKEMLKKHPEINDLVGVQPITALMGLLLSATQVSLAILLRDSYDQWYYYVIAYFIGATCSHAIFLAIHEITHFLAFRSSKLNYVVAILTNFPILLPYAASFKEYHLDHHRYLGVDGVDTDLPTKIEAILLQNVLGKAFFCSFMLFFYILRPVLVNPKTPSFWHFVNFSVQISFDIALFYFFGFGPFFYLLLSAFLAGSLHPCAGHFLAEHLAFDPKYETYSYYGILNYVSFNVGYHNEHHDFPNIPWTNLPKLRAIAPEFYDNLPFHKSWSEVLWKFVLDPNISLYNRVKRKTQKKTN